MDFILKCEISRWWYPVDGWEQGFVVKEEV